MAEGPKKEAATFAVRADSGALRRSATGSITGPLFVEVGGEAFPEPGWNDFPVVVLGWWIRALLELQRAGAATSCVFMDGPFEFELKPAGLSAWELRLIERHASAVQIVRSECVVPAEVLLAVHAAVVAVLEICAERGWSSKDIDQLQSAQDALCR